MFWSIFTVCISVFVFIVTFLLNRKIKVDVNIDEKDLPKDCLKCQNQTCLSNLKENYNKDNIDKIIEKCNKGENNNE